MKTNKRNWGLTALALALTATQSQAGLSSAELFQANGRLGLQMEGLGRGDKSGGSFDPLSDFDPTITDPAPDYSDLLDPVVCRLKGVELDSDGLGAIERSVRGEIIMESKEELAQRLKGMSLASDGQGALAKFLKDSWESIREIKEEVLGEVLRGLYQRAKDEVANYYDDTRQAAVDSMQEYGGWAVTGGNQDKDNGGQTP